MGNGKCLEFLMLCYLLRSRPIPSGEQDLLGGQETIVVWAYTCVRMIWGNSARLPDPRVLQNGQEGHHYILFSLPYLPTRYQYTNSPPNHRRCGPAMKDKSGRDSAMVCALKTHVSSIGGGWRTRTLCSLKTYVQYVC